MLHTRGVETTYWYQNGTMTHALSYGVDIDGNTRSPVRRSWMVGKDAVVRTLTTELTPSKGGS